MTRSILTLSGVPACRSETFECKNESCPGRTMCDIGWLLFSSCRVQRDSRYVLSGGQNAYACHTRRAIKYQLATCYMAKEPWPLLVRKLTSNRHTSARPDSYANSWECSFGLSGDAHGWADEATNKNDTSSIMCHFYWQSIVNEIRTRIILDSPS